MSLLPIFVPLAIVPLIILVVVLARRARERRMEAMRMAASTIGFAFQENGTVEAVMAMGALPLFGRGHTKRVNNVMTGRTGEQEVLLFDYQYTTGAGKESQTLRQTVALFPRAGRRLPDFVLAPENLFHKIGQAFGYQDIDFESHPEFSKHYLLRGKDESALRAAFGPLTLSYFEQRAGWNVEVQGETVGVYRSRKRTPPEDVPAFLEDARGVVRALVG